MKKLLCRAAAVFALSCFCSMPFVVTAQTPTYDETIGLIMSFEKQAAYTNATAGPMLHSIIQGMIGNEIPIQGVSEGLKRRLVGGASSKKILQQAAAANTQAEGGLLQLFYCTRQSPVPKFITDAGLKNRAKAGNGHGSAILNAEKRFWQNKAITTNLIQCLEGFSPGQAAVLVEIISAPFYSGSAHVYENTTTSWASQSLWYIYRDVRKVELAKRSVVVKLLANQQYLQIPAYTHAYFTYSGARDIIINLDPVQWSEADVPDLQKLLSNPYYADAAQAELTAMGH